MHSHRCGHDWQRRPEAGKLLYLALLGEPVMDQGCGYVWEHGEENKDNLDEHYCPRCGRGPWVIQHNDKSCALLGTVNHERSKEISVR